MNKDDGWYDLPKAHEKKIWLYNTGLVFKKRKEKKMTEKQFNINP